MFASPKASFIIRVTSCIAALAVELSNINQHIKEARYNICPSGGVCQIATLSNLAPSLC